MNAAREGETGTVRDLSTREEFPLLVARGAVDALRGPGADTR